jgi:hypothetical protein
MAQKPLTVTPFWDPQIWQLAISFEQLDNTWYGFNPGSTETAIKMEPSVRKTTFEIPVLDVLYCHKIKSGLMKSVTATKITESADYNSHKDQNIFSLVGSFLFIQVQEVWILGTVMVFLLRQVSVMSRLRLRQVSLSVPYVSSLHRCGSHFCFILITWNFLSWSYFIAFIIIIYMYIIVQSTQLYCIGKS